MWYPPQAARVTYSFAITEVGAAAGRGGLSSPRAEMRTPTVTPLLSCAGTQPAEVSSGVGQGRHLISLAQAAQNTPLGPHLGVFCGSVAVSVNSGGSGKILQSGPRGVLSRPLPP